MGEPFSITTAGGTIELDANRQGSADFAVTNVSGQAIEARAEVVAEAPAVDQWFSVAGAGERTFPIGGTEVYRVAVAVPTTAPASTCRFRLDVLGTDDPDEEQAQGQWVQFSIRPQPARPRPLPWLWIIAAAAAVVVVAAIVGAIVVLTHRQGTFSPTPTTVNFGTVLVSTTASQTVTVKNTGSVETTVDATITTGQGAGFSVATSACLGQDLAPSASCVINLAFTPATTGSQVGSLQITGDHASSRVVALTGTGSAESPARPAPRPAPRPTA